MAMEAVVADYYDEWSPRWEEQWGDKMNHGYYRPSDTVNASAHSVAQVRLIDEVLKFAGVSDDALKMPKNIVDVGCGFGPFSRYFAKKYGANCSGINLSPYQIQRAKELAAAEGLADKTFFIVGDALDQPFPDGQFDLVWAMDMADHISEKSKFFSELARIAAPGATTIITAYCHRDLSPTEETLQPDENNMLGKICKAFPVSLSCSLSDYVKIAESLSLCDIKTVDWSEYVVPTWHIYKQWMWKWKSFTSFFLRGWNNLKMALAIPLIIKAYDKKLIKYTVIVCHKPE